MRQSPGNIQMYPDLTAARSWLDEIKMSSNPDPFVPLFGLKLRLVVV